MISEIQVQNYRSLQDVRLPMASLTALVGPNGAGKTSILRAMDLVLGRWWPSLSSITVPEDFTDFDPSRELKIIVRFTPPLVHVDAMKKQQPIAGLQVSCRPYQRATRSAEAGDLHLEFTPINDKDQHPNVAVGWDDQRHPKFGPLLSVGSALRDQASVLFIDHRRSLTQHLPSTRGSMLGRLMAPVRKEFEASTGEFGRPAFTERYEAAMTALRTDKMKEVEATIADTAKSMLGFIGSRALSDVQIGFGFADPANPFNSVRLEYREGNLVVPGGQLGLGIQSAMVIGIFEASRRLREQVGTVVIEEPEMYLHPQAQRYFYRLLTELTEDGEAQVIYSTHSPIFADATRYEGIRLVRRPVGQHSRVNFVFGVEDETFLSSKRVAQKIATGFNAGRSELFFARKVLLVEGPGDQLAARIAAENLAIDLDGENLAIIECGSKTAIPFYARICRAFALPFVVLHDHDIREEVGDAAAVARIRARNREHRKTNEEITSLMTGAGQCYVIAPSLEGVLGIGRDADDKPRRVAEALRGLRPDALPQELRLALEQLAK